VAARVNRPHGAQKLFMQLPEQHCVSLKQKLPFCTQPHLLLLHWPEQQVAALKHCDPSAAHAAAHAPLVHVPEQHCDPCVHVWPEAPQPGAPQKPFTQLFEQHWPFWKHCCPSLVQFALAQVPL
jgi:hypothetical protein